MRGLFVVVGLTALVLGEEIPSFENDVRPIFEARCVGCHRAGEIGPMSLMTYRDVRPWAKAIREAVKLRKMPPWFADPTYGEFANDARLSDREIALIDRWVVGGAPQGKLSLRAEVRRIKPDADLLLTAPKPFVVKAGSVIDYQFLIFPQKFAEDRWVRRVETRPSDRGVVHHAVLYVRDPNSQWLREAPVGVAYSPPGSDVDAFRRSRDTKEDILAVYTPGASAVELPEGMAKKIPAGGDLVLQLHYTSKKTDAADRPQIALTFARQAPEKRVLTLQMGRDDIRIPPGDANYRAMVGGTVPQDALLISMFPHMHLRGKAFEFELVGTHGAVETLLRVAPFNFNWQLNYILKTPRMLRKGTRLRWTGYFDNSANNPNNPDAAAEVTWGEQSWEEMMIGFFDVAVSPDVDKAKYFVR